MKPRLTVSILTQHSQERLGRLITEVRAFADEVIVGVDATSTDQTLDVAQQFADVVYRLHFPEHLQPARLLPLEYASGDWILSLDDDESMEEAFDSIAVELMSDPRVTHYYFPRKWIVSLDPCEYLRATPWFPNWALRLFRNDASLVWKAPLVHSQYWVQGLGCFEGRANILHFEQVLYDSEARRKKIELYRQWGSQGEAEDYYAPPAGVPRQLATLRRPPPPQPARPPARADLEIRHLELIPRPPWKARLTNVATPTSVTAGTTTSIEMLARNTGKLAWCPHLGRWPTLNLGFHLLGHEGQVIQYDGTRFPMPRFARPGEEVLFLGSFQAPSAPGEYLLEWDLVSEGECWFADCGSPPLRIPLHVQ